MNLIHTAKNWGGDGKLSDSNYLQSYKLCLYAFKKIFTIGLFQNDKGAHLRGYHNSEHVYAE